MEIGRRLRWLPANPSSPHESGSSRRAESDATLAADLGGKRTLRLVAESASVRRMQGCECWFCGQTIDPKDVNAVFISIANLWRSGADAPAQAIAAHSSCARERLKGTRMEIDPRTFGEDA